MADKNIGSFLKRVGTGKTLIWFIVCLFIFCLGFVIHGNVGLFFNFTGMLVVFGGTFGATLICYRVEKLTIAYKVFRLLT